MGPHIMISSELDWLWNNGMEHALFRLVLVSFVKINLYHHKYIYIYIYHRYQGVMSYKYKDGIWLEERFPL